VFSRSSPHLFRKKDTREEGVGKRVGKAGRNNPFHRQVGTDSGCRQRRRGVARFAKGREAALHREHEVAVGGKSRGAVEEKGKGVVVTRNIHCVRTVSRLEGPWVKGIQSCSQKFGIFTDTRLFNPQATGGGRGSKNARRNRPGIWPTSNNKWRGCVGKGGG